MNKSPGHLCHSPLIGRCMFAIKHVMRPDAKVGRGGYISPLVTYLAQGRELNGPRPYADL